MADFERLSNLHAGTESTNHGLMIDLTAARAEAARWQEWGKKFAKAYTALEVALTFGMGEDATDDAFEPLTKCVMELRDMLCRAAGLPLVPIEKPEETK